MADRDYKVVYKSRVVLRDSERSDQDRRPRIPTALDPYDYPYEAEGLSRVKSARARDSSSTIDTASNVSTSRPSRTVYPVQQDSRETYADVERSRRDRPSRISRSIVEDSDRASRRGNQTPSDVRSPRASGALYDDSPRSSRTTVEAESNPWKGRRGDYVIDDDFRRDGNTYVMDSRGEVEIIMPGRERERTSDGRGPRYVYTNATPTQRKQYYENLDGDEADDLPRGVVILRRDATPPGYSQPRYGSDNKPTRKEYHEDDDWRLVESMRETRIDTTQPPQSYSRGRPRAPTQSSEDSYVMVSPEGGQNQQSKRSSMQRTDYPPSELRRRRSRSISFREKEVRNHDASECRHERPGAEANICGTYLRNRSVDDFEQYDERESTTRSNRGRARSTQDSEIFTGKIQEDRYQEPYPPQQGFKTEKRSRSRRRRKTEDVRDDESYYSQHKTYTKKTTYL